ncbi:hypothetical protein I2I05_00985 [Hymenobacter sp. BT683]|uniref:Transmembrane protein n=1 Tax=Hymenobacter jeongseonensis TaxID=2791027 RepID=A0ABS0IC84_9BACT|nr:hypothetical protein [Hymenobacter jeongseonensis]MBF9235959.1 hypothetical protein [Hymenobacter jeongseonensis]
MTRIGLFGLSAAAAWLRMFDRSLSWQVWADLVGKPVSHWAAALAVLPLFELFYSWPGHVLLAACHGAICRRRDHHTPSRGHALAAGVASGATCFLWLAAWNHDGLMRSSAYNGKLALIYTAAGLCYGAAYYHLIAKPRRNQQVPNLPLK